MTTKIETYDYPDGRWRWRAKDENGQIIGRGGKSYDNRADCLREFYALTDGDYLFALAPGSTDYTAIAEGHHEPCSSHGCIVCDQDGLPL
jgi:uncharacterized protein YegP (UPF0339 family)